MLRYLHIKNFALIDELELSFDQGFNVITGETGAGKSLLMQAIGLAVGGRATTEVIRHDTPEAIVEAVFDISDGRIIRLLEESGYSADDELLVRRVISQNGRGRVYLNGAVATVALLRSLGERLMHIYGQHEQQTLLETEAALQLLDGFAGLGSRSKEMSLRYQSLQKSWSHLQALTQGKESARARRELLRLQADEVKLAALQPGEEERLRQEKAILLNAEKLAQGVAGGEEVLVAGEEALTDRMGRVITRLRDLTRIDGSLKEAIVLLSSGLAQVEEAALVLRKYGERLQVNPDRLEEIDARLTSIARLKQKYGGSVEAILAFHAAVEQELRQLEGGEESLIVIRQEVETAAEAAWSWAHQLSQDRQTAARTLEGKMMQELAGLGMKGATFQVDFHAAASRMAAAAAAADPLYRQGRRLSESGCDSVEFALSANPGEPLLPLINVASGGELSRLMLALKVLGTAAEEAPTLIFDEVDAGIGGAVAEVVGRRLKMLATHRQVLCITHLPQIAAFADYAYTVVKTSANGRTISSAKKLTKPEQLHELARMVGGVEITAEARRHAKEMLEGAQKVKS